MAVHKIFINLSSMKYYILILHFFHNRASVTDAIMGRLSRKVLLGSAPMLFLTRNNGALNIFTTPELYRDAKKSFLRNLTEIGFYRVSLNILRDFRYKLIDPHLNINALHESECDKTVVTTFKEDFCFTKI